MSLVVFQHEAHETGAVLAATLNRHGHRLRTIELFAGDEVPVDLDDVDGIISLGGAPNVDEAAKYPWMTKEIDYLKAAYQAGKPIVGICLGAQLIAAALGGKVAPMAAPGAEVGWKNVKLSFPGQTDVVLQGIPWDTVQFHMHGQEVTALPPESAPLASSKLCKIQAFRVGTTTYGFQYHFEWTIDDIAAVLKDPLIFKAGESATTITAQHADYYHAYRRLADRLCDNIATFLFPIKP